MQSRLHDPHWLRIAQSGHLSGKSDEGLTMMTMSVGYLASRKQSSSSVTALMQLSKPDAVSQNNTAHSNSLPSRSS